MIVADDPWIDMSVFGDEEDPDDAVSDADLETLRRALGVEDSDGPGDALWEHMLTQAVAGDDPAAVVEPEADPEPTSESELQPEPVVEDVAPEGLPAWEDGHGAGDDPVAHETWTDDHQHGDDP